MASGTPGFRAPRDDLTKIHPPLGGRKRDDVIKDKPDIYPPQGFIWYARRLNRHSYHLTDAWNPGPPLCGSLEELGINRPTMKYLLGHDSHKRCVECLKLAGRDDLAAEVRAAKEAHAKAEATHAVQMREALKALHFPGAVDDLSPGQLVDELRRIERDAGAAWRGMPF